MSAIDCEDFRKYIDPYLDGEFADRECAEFDAHLAVCSDCRAHYERRAWFQRTIKPALQCSEAMPPDVRARMLDCISEAERPARMRRAVRRLMIPIPAIAAAGVVALLVSPLTGFSPVVVGDAVDYHCQQLPVEALPGTGTDNAEVVDWFDGKLPFQVQAPQFRDQRVRLLGGRLSHIRAADEGSARRAAYLVYGVGSHKLSVLVFDGRNLDLDDGGEARKVKGQRLAMHDANGYRVALYQRGPLAYAVTSDLPERDMIDLIGSAF